MGIKDMKAFTAMVSKSKLSMLVLNNANTSGSIYMYKHNIPQYWNSVVHLAKIQTSSQWISFIFS